MRVAAGAIARKWMKERFGITIQGWMSQLGPIRIPFVDATQIRENLFSHPTQRSFHSLRNTWTRCASPAILSVPGSALPPPAFRQAGAKPVYDRLDAEIALRDDGHQRGEGVEIGDGFASIEQKGASTATK